MKEQGDAELWGAAVDGNGAAFGLLFDRHRDRLFRAALHSVPTPVDAEDAVATAFLELWRRRKDVRLVDGSVLPWLLSTTHNVTRTLFRHQRRHRAFLARLPREGSERSAEEVTMEAAEGFRRQQQVAVILAKLRPADSELLMLIASDELSIAEVAAVLGISTDATKQRLSRARQRARRAGSSDITKSGLEPAGGGAP